MSHRGAGAVLLGMVLAAGPAAAARESPRAPLGGPISDFWSQVKRDWSNAIPGLRSGPTQTYEWVSLVYGSAGEDEALDDLLEREMRVWAKWQRRSWVRSMFWKKRYDRLDRESFYGSRALRKNLVVMGSPRGNPMLTEMFEGTPFRVGDETVSIGDREYSGPSLVLAFIRPNPFGDGTYALVLAATGRDALLDLGRLPLGPTDYVLFRGAHAIDMGFLDWSRPGAVALGRERQTFPDHEGFDEERRGALTVRFHPREVARERAREIAGRHAAELERIAPLLRAPAAPPVEEYLYANADSMLRQTGRPGPVSFDLAGRSVHQVLRDGTAPPVWPLAAVVAWDAWGPTDLDGLLRGAALLAQPEVEGQSLDAWAARLIARGALPDLEDLLPGSRRREADGSDALASLGAGSFVSFLAEEHGVETVERYYREARAANFRDAFRGVFGRSLRRAEKDWRDRLPSAPAVAEPPGGAPAPSSPATTAAAGALQRGEVLFRERRDAEADAALAEALALDPGLARAWMLRARLAFRAGRDGEAMRLAGEALLLAPGDADVRSWSRVTLGRAHAARGDLLAARLDLTDPDVSGGPDAPRLLADLWLENLGLSPNRRAAAAFLAEQAEIDLQYYDWDAAEARALQILAADPGNAPAHHLLARIRLHRFGYWYHFATLYNELFPGTSPSDPTQYWHMVQSSTRESYKGAYLETGLFSALDLDREKGAFPGEEEMLQSLYPSVREPDPGGLPDAAQHLLRARAHYLARDWRRAASEARLALDLDLPVSDTRAWALFLLGDSEVRLGDREHGAARLREALTMRPSRGVRRQIEEALARSQAPEE